MNKQVTLVYPNLYFHAPSDDVISGLFLLSVGLQRKYLNGTQLHPREDQIKLSIMAISLLLLSAGIKKKTAQSKIVAEFSHLLSWTRIK